MKVEYSPEARDDLESIFDFIAIDDPLAAASWTERLIERAESAGRFPRKGRVVPEVGDRDVREVFLGTYRIIYRIEPARVFVLTILEGHQRLDLAH